MTMLGPSAWINALVLAVVGIAGTARIAHANEATSLRLFGPDNALIGWEYGPVPATGWTLCGGSLSGSQESSPLLSGWTFGDFDLAFDWAVQDDGVVKISFPVVPPLKDRIPDPHIMPRYELLLSEGDNGCQFFDGERLVARGALVAKRDRHSAALRRRGMALTIRVDDLPELATTIRDVRLGLGVAIPQGRARIINMTAAEPMGEPLFNGKDTSGWRVGVRGQPDAPAWSVQNGDLVCPRRGGDYLRADRCYANFTLSLEYNLARRGNSGIGIRTPNGGWPSGDGIELQLYDEPPDAPLTRHSTMALYGNLEPFARAERPGQWNQAVVKAEGYMITGWINGVLVQHANTLRLPELKHRQLSGWIGLQDHHSAIRFRNVRLLVAPDGLGMPGWFAPRPESGSQVVLDRLMNTERLARDDAVRSGCIVRKITHSGEVLLADLTGPGAVVEISAIGAKPVFLQSDLAFHFDATTEPQLRSTLARLHQQAPAVSEEGFPRLTYLAFRDRLKITMTARELGEVRIDYVRFPHDLTTGSYTDTGHGIARGLLPAISYRLDQMDGGRLRELDPAVKYTAPPQSVSPGATLELLRATGAGVVDWWKLQAPAAVLTNNDLQLTIRVDGESQPAIQAPARFLFPGLAAGRNWHNFVLLDNEGATSRLALPFQNGITISATNAGSGAIDGIGFAISVLPAESAHSLPRGRLRGAFVTSPSDDDLILALKGKGRCVALVGEDVVVPEVLLSLHLDGQRQETWSQSCRSFFALDAPGDLHAPLSGRATGLVWRYLLLAPIEFDRSLELRGHASPGKWLALYYDQP
jgi:hypothetical protein